MTFLRFSDGLKPRVKPRAFRTQVVHSHPVFRGLLLPGLEAQQQQQQQAGTDFLITEDVEFLGLTL